MTTIDVEDSELLERAAEERAVESGEELVELKEPKRRRAARGDESIGFAKAKWGASLADPNARAPSAHQGKPLRRRLRAPLQAFDEALTPTRDKA